MAAAERAGELVLVQQDRCFNKDMVKIVSLLQNILQNSQEDPVEPCNIRSPHSVHKESRTSHLGRRHPHPLERLIFYQRKPVFRKRVENVLDQRGFTRT